MRATEIVLPGIGEPETLRVRTRELPEPGRRARRSSASRPPGVSFAEQQMRRGKYYDQPPFPFVPGYDLVGVVEDAPGRRGGRADQGRRLGRPRRPRRADLVPVPDGVDAVAAETVVVNGVTAWRMLHRARRCKPGETIVVLGAAGGVGTVLVQLARHAGIRVIGTAGPKQQERLRELGAIAVDYRNEDVPARVRELAPGRRGGGLRPRRRPRHRRLVADARARRHARLLRHRLDARRARQPAGAGAQAAGPADRLERAPQRAQGDLLQPVGRQALRPDRYRAQLREDLGQRAGPARRRARSPRRSRRASRSREAAAALRFAEAGGNTGKVVILP